MRCVGANFGFLYEGVTPNIAFQLNLINFYTDSNHFSPIMPQLRPAKGRPAVSRRSNAWHRS